MHYVFPAAAVAPAILYAAPAYADVPGIDLFVGQWGAQERA
jgi:hypothetical protein